MLSRSVGTCMRGLYESPEIQRFERSDIITVCDGIMFFFLPGTATSTSVFKKIRVMT